MLINETPVTYLTTGINSGLVNFDIEYYGQKNCNNPNNQDRD